MRFRHPEREGPLKGRAERGAPVIAQILAWILDLWLAAMARWDDAAPANHSNPAARET